MRVLIITVNIDIPWVQSLKEKRMEVRSLVEKAKKRFNLSVMETENHDYHQTITLTLAGVALGQKEGENLYQKIMDYLEKNTQGNISIIEKEFY